MYQVCAGDPDAFTLDGEYDTATPTSESDASCSNDYIGIEGLTITLKYVFVFCIKFKHLGATAQCSQSTGANMNQKFCGNVFGFGSAAGADLSNGVVCGEFD